MSKRKFFQLLAYLTKEEFKQFERYVQSPFFNSNKKIISLVKQLKKIHPNYEHKDWTDKKIYTQAFGSQLYKEQQWKNLLSESLQLLNGFLVQTTLKTEKFYTDYCLLESLSIRNANHFFVRKLAQVRKKLKATTNKEATHYYLDFMIEQLAFSHRISKEGRIRQSSLPVVFQKLATFYNLSKLRHCANIANRQFIAAQTKNLELVASTLQELASQDLSNLPILHAWHTVVKMLYYSNIDMHYFNLKALLHQYENSLPQPELRQFYAVAINYCNQKYQRGNRHYLHEIFVLYKKMINTKVLLQDGYIRPPTHFNNIVRVGLLVDEVAWTAQFIDQNESRLPAEHRTNYVSYARALVSFQQQKYQESWVFLQKYEFKHPFDWVFYYRLFVKILYQLAEWELLEVQIARFKAYLQNNKKVLPQSFIQRHQHFLNYLTKIYKLQFEVAVDKHSKRQNLTKEIQEPEVQIFGQTWLLDILRQQ